MSARPGYVGLLTLQEQVQFAATEGSLSWLIEEMQVLAQAETPTHGVTPEGWAELAEGAVGWRDSITDLLDVISKHKAGGR